MFVFNVYTTQRLTAVCHFSQVLIANCFGRQLGSIEIALNQETKEVIFRVEAVLGKYPEGVELRIPYRVG